MKVLKNLICIFYLLFLSEISFAQGKIENFTLLNVINNQSFSLAEYKKEKCIVIIFTSNYCPYSKLYEDRLLKMYNTFSNEGVKFIFINSNISDDYNDDSIEQMEKKAADKKFNFPYLADKKQEVAIKFGVIKNPDAFVLINIDGNFIVKYKGAIDNNPQVEEDVTQHYLKDAIRAVINHKNIEVAEKKTTGCVIRKD